MTKRLETQDMRVMLHQLIENADDEHISALYLLLGRQTASRYDSEALVRYNERYDADIKGEMRSLTSLEFFATLRATK